MTGERKAVEYRIREVSARLGLSVDTLRYYEKIGLLPDIKRFAAGTRVYSERDISRLRFIMGARHMGFSLSDIAKLLRLRDDPRDVRIEARQLAQQKLENIHMRLRELTALRDELTLLLSLCRCADEGCPILEGIEDSSITDRANPDI